MKVRNQKGEYIMTLRQAVISFRSLALDQGEGKRAWRARVRATATSYRSEALFCHSTRASRRIPPLFRPLSHGAGGLWNWWSRRDLNPQESSKNLRFFGPKCVPKWSFRYSLPHVGQTPQASASSA